jgi:phosphoribosyl 1,2-cyclic phosphodiesterase
MQLFITSLNSGSNGNCYYIGNQEEAVLVDAGISCRETETRMNRLGLSMGKVKAIFISHEHSDHIRGVEVLAKKYQLPVYITPKTLQYSRLVIEPHLVYPFTANEPIQIGDLEITGFSKFHDASDPHSFVVSYQQTRIGVFTDIGAPCENLVRNFQQCHAIFLEANYDDEMLDNGHYPLHLKRRIKSNHGHLSNKQALDLFTEFKAPYLSLVLLSHLSRENNSPKVAKELFQAYAGETEVVVASRYEESPVFTISALEDFNPEIVPLKPFLKTVAQIQKKAAKKPAAKKAKNPHQLSLEF